MAKYLICSLVILYACSNEPSKVTMLEILPTSSCDSSATVYEEMDTVAYNSVVAIDWELLAKVDYTENYVAALEEDIAFPIFSDQVKELHNRLVTITGYVVPIEETSDHTAIILSAFPYTQCFFCGLAGPESVMDIVPANNLKRFSPDEQVQFRGRLQLNATDWDKLIYILEDAALVPQ